MVTLRDVARRSGVSPATVSNVLHNRERNATPATRKRVLDAIRELGYHPGAVPPRGPRVASKTIGLVMWLAKDSPLSEYPFAITLLDGILSTSLTQSWNLTIFCVEHWDDAKSQVRLYADGRCDGFIIISPPQNSIKEALIERNYPFVLLCSGDDDPRVNSVGIDDASATDDLTSFLISKGHRRIAYFIGDAAMLDTKRRIEGFVAALEKAQIPNPQSWIVGPGTYDFPDSSRIINDYLTEMAALPLAERPTAIMCANDQIAVEACRLIKSHGLRVPEDISVAGFDGTTDAKSNLPPIATIHQPLFSIAQLGCKTLIEHINAVHSNNPRPAPICTFLPYNLIQAESVADIS